MLIEKAVDSWEEFGEQVKKLRQQSESQGRSASSVLFRGQEDSNWRLTTTLERSGQPRMLFEDYYRLIYRIRPQIESFTGNQWEIPECEEVAALVREYDAFSLRLTFGPRPGYSYMAYLRHHGFPSPLLDWTRSPQVAAYFAFSRATESEKTVSIYALLDESPGGSNGVLCICRLGPYVRTHQRHFLQQSEYTLCLIFDENKQWRFSAYQEVFEFPCDLHQGSFWKFNIPSRERLRVLRLLDESNLNEFSLFGSEESLLSTIQLRELEFRS